MDGRAPIIKGEIYCPRCQQPRAGVGTVKKAFLGYSNPSPNLFSEFFLNNGSTQILQDNRIQINRHHSTSNKHGILYPKQAFKYFPYFLSQLFICNFFFLTPQVSSFSTSLFLTIVTNYKKNFFRGDEVTRQMSFLLKLTYISKLIKSISMIQNFFTSL